MKRFWLWQYMLNKRLLHKKAFVLLLCLAPLLVWGMSRLAGEDSGIQTVLLSVEDSRDALALQIVEELLQEDSILLYEVVEPETAREMVAAGKADCAWIFRQDFEEKLISTFAEDVEMIAPIYVVTQEDTVALQLARTKLYGAVYPHLAKLLSEYFVQTQLGGSEILAEELALYRQANVVEEGLFQVLYEGAGQNRGIWEMGGTAQDDASITDESHQNGGGGLAELSYLLMPVRGILLVFLLICGLVVTLYYLQDKERGMFAWLPMHKRRGLLYCYLFGACFDVAVVVILSLFISEGRLISLRELVLLVLYVCMTAVFCELMKLLCRTGERLARWIPLISLAMLVLCPIFLDLGSGFVLQYLFPPTYYLRALQSNRALSGMVIYTTVLFIGETICHRLLKH